MINPNERPHHKPLIPRPPAKQSAYPSGNPTNQCPARFHIIGVRIPEAPENAGGDSLNTVEELEHRRNREQDTPTSSTDVSCVKLPMMGRLNVTNGPPHKA